MEAASSRKLHSEVEANCGICDESEASLLKSRAMGVTPGAPCSNAAPSEQQQGRQPSQENGIWTRSPSAASLPLPGKLIEKNKK
jgi:hypothetical protein